MSNTLKVLDALIEGLNLVTETQKALQSVATVIQNAQAENRDITDEEVKSIREGTDAAIERLRNARRNP